PASCPGRRWSRPARRPLRWATCSPPAGARGGWSAPTSAGRRKRHGIRTDRLRLGHSYSKIIHERLCGYAYQLHPLPTEAEARRFLEERPFRAINVTIPYKRLVMEYCDEIDPRAAAIGAVNTVVNRGGRLDRKSTRLNSSHVSISYAVFCLKTKSTNLRIDAAECGDNVRTRAEAHLGIMGHQIPAIVAAAGQVVVAKDVLGRIGGDGALRLM